MIAEKDDEQNAYSHVAAWTSLVKAAGSGNRHGYLNLPSYGGGSVNYGFCSTLIPSHFNDLNPDAELTIFGKDGGACFSG